MTDNDPAIELTDLEEVGRCRVVHGIVDQPGLETVEGRFVPLLAGEGIRSHIIVMHPGQWCHPHPHDTESLIYTVSGRWVFTTTEDGELDGAEVRTVMQAGDLFHFVPHVPTGFETPLGEGATILILKGSGGTYASMRDAMASARDSLAEQAAAGEAFSMAELPDDHPSHVFAREVLAAEASS